MTNVSELAAYQNDMLKLRLHEGKIAYILVLILVPSGFFLDYIYYREYFTHLVWIRSICVAALLLLYLYSFSPNALNKDWLVGLAWPLIINIAICVMIYITDGVASPYYAGLNLVLVGAALMALTLYESLFILVSTLLFYILAIAFHDPDAFTNQVGLLFNNLFFILLTGIIGATAIYVKEKQRKREFFLRYELDERNKELAEMDRIKSDFFANISHELRTPLTLILSPVEDLLHSGQPFDFKVNQLLKTVQNNSYRLLKLVNDLLSVIRLDEQNGKLDCEPVEVKAQLRSIVNSMQHLAGKQQITLQNKLDFEPIFINGNMPSLEKIFINLLNNAIKFTPPGGTIQVSSHNDPKGITIIIQDTGIGISKADLPHIFDRFKQADSSSTRKYQGTGLGLALVKELTQALGGKIEAQSELGSGTRMCVTFPVIDEQTVYRAEYTEITDSAQQPNKDQQTSSLEKIHQQAEYSIHLNTPNVAPLVPSKIKTQTTNDQHYQATLLVVEDEPELRAYLVNLLSDEYRVLSAPDGETGREIIMQHRPDLVVLDLMLPKLDGLNLCKIIKADSHLQSAKVVLLTARIDEESKIKALKFGADDFITKPFSTVEVKSRLHNLWNARQLEIDLKMQNRELKQALADLKAMESKLIHSEKLNAIGSLAAGLLHEVNNPLNYAITAVQILQRDPAIKIDNDLQEMVDDIYEGMDRIRHIVKDLHAFAYPDTADKELPFKLIDAVESALRFTANEHKDITIDVNIAESMIVTGSNNHIVQVLINLITNACKALVSVDDPRINISAHTMSTPVTKSDIGQPTMDKVGRVIVRVRDNGSGIDDEFRSRIFEPFFTTRDVGEGLGMGLSICHTIIEQHGGSIQVESEAGQFTEFSFDLAGNESASE